MRRPANVRSSQWREITGANCLFRRLPKDEKIDGLDDGLIIYVGPMTPNRLKAGLQLLSTESREDGIPSGRKFLRIGCPSGRYDLRDHLRGHRVKSSVLVANPWRLGL